jgi:hypothetical protein
VLARKPAHLDRLSRRFFEAALALLALGCSQGAVEASGSAREHDSENDLRIVPEGLAVSALPGGNGVLEVVALTLQKGPNGAELYAALRNEGDVPACSAAFSAELFDKDEQSLAVGIGGLLTQHFYRLTDGSGSIAACIGPGDVSMVAVTDLPPELAVEDVGYVVYRCPYFALDVVPIAGLTVSPLRIVTRRSGTSYAGTLINEFDVVVTNPSVTVFPVNRVGRPLGVATGSGTVELSPGDQWVFETDSVGTSGVDYFAYPAGALGE